METELVSFLGGVVLATALLVVTAFCRKRGSTRKHKLPPGPWSWPVIGNLNLIGSLPHRSIHALSARYGPFMSLRFGSVPVVVGSSVDAAMFFLRTNDVSFIDRPKMAAGKHTAYDYADMVWSPYGAYWRQARKLWKTHIFGARQLSSHEQIRGEEVRGLLRGLYGLSPSSPSVELRQHLQVLNLNTMSRMALGRKYFGVGVDEDTDSPISSGGELRWMFDELFALTSAVCIGDFIPWLSWLDPQGYVRRMKRLGKMVDRFLEHVVDEHNERRRLEGDKFVATDMMDLLLQHADDPNLEVPIQRDGVKAFTLDLIFAGSHTSTVTIEWAMSELLRNPEVLAKATNELDDIIGPGRLVTEQDIGSLPYLDAILKETFRLHPVAPILSPRLCREDTSTTSGYDVPKGTLVFVNVWTIGRDPAVWGDKAAEFWPERFIGSGVDVKGQDMKLLPFGSGRRMCPGYIHGMRMVQLTLANLLHAFAWRLPDGVATDDLNMQEKIGMALELMIPLQAVAKPKLPVHLFERP